jgi:lipoyl(octanoyl) transferase
VSHEKISFISLAGLSDYEETLRLQKRLVDERANGTVPDTVLFVEHSAVLTAGRGAKAEEWAELNVIQTERGGALTYHSPGQLVIYPIISIRKFGITGYLRMLEGIVRNVLAAKGVTARAEVGRTGVWVGNHKIASIGIAVRRWVSYHGIAINVVNELDGFRRIRPCGMSSAVMTRLANLIHVSDENWRKQLEDLLKFEFTAAFTGRESVLKAPSIEAVVAKAFCFSTPRIIMHMW